MDGKFSRRSFGLACAGLLVNARAHAEPLPRMVTLRGGGVVPALGMGSWRLAQGRRPYEQELEALKTGISLGMTVIDTAEMYGDGASEEMIGRAVAGKREKVILVSKILPSNATRVADIRRACAESLRRLNTAAIDIYLLHWRGGVSRLDVVVDTFEALRAEGKIHRWGVSNFDVRDMEELFRIDRGQNCAVNQVEYSLGHRDIETDLVPWSVSQGIPLMAYSPLGKGSRSILHNQALAQIAASRGISSAAVAIAWTMRNGCTIAIPESGSIEHVHANLAAMNCVLNNRELAELDHAFPA